MKIGILLTEEDSDKVLDLVSYVDATVYDIISNAIDAMYDVIILGDESMADDE